ncbi:MAG: ROK family transcriptional regulator [Deltaproteobacteria bacterium]|jgi:predicted NBD/HSP70 family sugar kinase|nr:ROK family transcriptional regulator [Deltaproteobacteria bacterium]
MDHSSIRASNIDVKRLNRNRVFRYINRHGRLSKPEVAQALGMSSPTVLFITNELIEKGLLREEGEFESSGGRKAKALSANHDNRFAFGLDITCNHFGVVLTNLSGAVIKHVRMKKRFKNTGQYWKSLSESLEDFKRSTSVPDEKILGVGIALPGIIDLHKKRLTFSHVLKVFDLPCEEISRDFTLPVAFTNDANAAALAELQNRQDYSQAIYLSLSNSVGGAMILRKEPSLGQKREADAWQNENLVMGDNFKGGEIGHMTLIPGGQPCYCGKIGCFDAYCNAKILSQYTDGLLADFFRGLEAGEPIFKTEWERYLDHLAYMINSLRMLFDCKVIVGGYVGGFIESYLEDLRSRLRTLDTFGDDGSYVEACAYRFEASALGAALLHIEAYINTI